MFFCAVLVTSALQAWKGAYYNGTTFKFQPASSTGGFFYKLWTKNSQTPMVNVLNNLRPFQITILKYNGKSILFTFSLLIKTLRLKIKNYVISYTFQSNLLLELNFDLGKCPKKETCTFTFIRFLVRALTQVQNKFQEQI